LPIQSAPLYTARYWELKTHSSFVQRNGIRLIGIERAKSAKTDDESRRLARIDTVLGNVESPVFLKVDTQGYELEILKGSKKLLPDIEAILLEVAIIEINEGAPLLHEVLGFLKSIGFVTYDILEIHRRPLDQALNQIDILFLRENSSLIADKRHFA